jgi:hypothetical protein
MYDIYSNDHEDSWRFTLGRSGSRKVIVIGLNPSTATQERSDTTVAKVDGVASRNNFDGFVMTNLYPVRSTDYNNLPHDVNDTAYLENLNHIEAVVSAEPNPVIWAAWGESVSARSYFVVAIAELHTRLQRHAPSWQNFGPLTNSGHPRHPSRLRYAWSFSQFDMKQYVQRSKIGKFN